MGDGGGVKWGRRVGSAPAQLPLLPHEQELHPFDELLCVGHKNHKVPPLQTVRGRLVYPCDHNVPTQKRHLCRLINDSLRTRPVHPRRPPVVETEPGEMDSLHVSPPPSLVF